MRFDTMPSRPMAQSAHGGASAHLNTGLTTTLSAEEDRIVAIVAIALLSRTRDPARLTPNEVPPTLEGLIRNTGPTASIARAGLRFPQRREPP